MLTVSPDLVAVGKRIAFYRRQCCWTQDNLAFAVGVSRSSIANLERGRYDAKLSIMLRIADALNVAPNAIFADDLDMPSLANAPATPEAVDEVRQCRACSDQAYARGLCHVHYRMWRAGDAHYDASDPLYRRLTVDDALKIRALYATGTYSYRALARAYGVSHITIRDVILHKRFA
ncbi:helix-turn-helix domain-containing protein [Mycobacterium sp. BMJ-28]